MDQDKLLVVVSGLVEVVAKLEEKLEAALNRLNALEESYNVGIARDILASEVGQMFRFEFNAEPVAESALRIRVEKIDGRRCMSVESAVLDDAGKPSGAWEPVQCNQDLVNAIDVAAMSHGLEDGTYSYVSVSQQVHEHSHAHHEVH